MARLRTQGQSRRGSPRARCLALLLLAPLLAAAAVLGPGTAQAKEFRPGDLRVCNAHRCIAITTPTVLQQLEDGAGIHWDARIVTHLRDLLHEGYVPHEDLEEENLDGHTTRPVVHLPG